ncbi:hypothetical protein TESG_02518 [Trichophyton tonsurans CBS 112818]|uniref:Uncharacterized protein n=2 Tax=Trichophyton TaxID=5550 RepID=F2PW94_TRIEC|nr:hypothetical protein TESG_02518 [Trichophyton tonsurans CBS 112818]EGE06162.1 hypothetical protein TEQG_05058 [Trichophyton equinum CBS 127.97]
MDTEGHEAITSLQDGTWIDGQKRTRKSITTSRDSALRFLLITLADKGPAVFPEKEKEGTHATLETRQASRSPSCFQATFQGSPIGCDQHVSKGWTVRRGAYQRIKHRESVVLLSAFCSALELCLAASAVYYSNSCTMEPKRRSAKRGRAR